MNAVVVFTLTISLSFSPFIHTLARAFLRINASDSFSFFLFQFPSSTRTLSGEEVYSCHPLLPQPQSFGP